MSESASLARRRGTAVASVYAAALVQGLTLVSFPASGAVLKQMQGFSDAQYGAIFLPQVAAAVLGAVVGAQLAPRTGLKLLLIAALVANLLSQLVLASVAGQDAAHAFVAVLAATAAMGLGFGLLGAPMNGYPPLLFPRRAETAIVVVHTLVGAGLALGPLLAGAFIDRGAWRGFPLALAALAALVLVVAAVSRFPSEGAPAASGPGERVTHPMRAGGFWLLVSAAVLYAFAEGTFSNWIVIYLAEGKGLGEMTGATALSMFWAAMVGGRLAISLLIVRVPSQSVWLALPVLMVCAFLLLPYATDPASGIGLFALAGLACSGFFPLTVALASTRFRAHVPWVSSMLIAALMVGVGLGSFGIGSLRSVLSFERLYQLSSLYPLAMLVLAAVLLGASREPRAKVVRA